MAGALADAVGAALGAWAEALEGRPLINECLADPKGVTVEVVVVLTIGDGGGDDLVDVLAGRLRREAQDIKPVGSSTWYAA